MNIGEKIRELRKRKGFSQEQLADEAKISIRTVQRVEAGESFPNGDSLIKLSNALEVTIDDILEIAPLEDVGYLTLLHLSSITIIFHPLLGIVCPLVMWILKKESIKGVNSSGKKLVTFQIIWTLVLYVVLFILSEGILMLDVRLDLIFYYLLSGTVIIKTSVIAGLYLINIILISINTVRIRRGKETKYLPSLNFTGNIA